MKPILRRCSSPLTEKDVQALAEFLRQSTSPNETHLHSLLEKHPAVLQVLGFHEFVSEFPLEHDSV